MNSKWHIYLHINTIFTIKQQSVIHPIFLLLYTLNTTLKYLTPAAEMLFWRGRGPYWAGEGAILTGEGAVQKYLYSEEPILKHMNFRQKILQVSVLLRCHCK
jgi:hypothetical protein